MRYINLGGWQGKYQEKAGNQPPILGAKFQQLWHLDAGGHEKAPLHKSQPGILISDGHYRSVRR